MTTRERLHLLVDQLPEAQLEEVRADLERRADPVGWLFAHAPEGPPLDEAEAAQAAESWEQVRRGEERPAEEVWRDLGV